ncbi:MAG: helix-turn-helix domain-containing protein [Myxococcota bacterium]
MSEATVRKLLVAARRMFRDVGYDRTSMDDLCAAAGLTRGALYHHFGGKAGLLEAVVVEIYDEVGQRCLNAFERESDPWTGLKSSCRHYLEIALEPDVQRVVFQTAPAVLGQRLRDIDARFATPLETLLSTLMTTGRIRQAPPAPLARMFIGAMMDLALWVTAQAEPERALEQAVASFDVFLSGLELAPDPSKGQRGLADHT